jgi:hypothetical protein
VVHYIYTQLIYFVCKIFGDSVAQEALVEINQHRPLLEKKDDGLIALSGIASEAGVKNGNGRIYPLAVMQRAVDEAQAKIEEGSFNGELDHPEWGYRGKLQDTAMRFTKLFMEGTVVKFEAVLLDTSRGRELKALIEGGVKIGMSTRGAGSLRYEETEDGEEILYVDSDYEMFGIDAVDIPSSANGILKMQEKLEESMNKARGYTPKGNEMSKEIKTVADLKEAHGSLVSTIEEAAKAEASAEKQAWETEKQGLEESVSAKDTEITNLQAQLTEANKAVAALEDVKKTLLGETKAATAGDDAVVVGLDAVMDRLNALQESNEALQAKLNERDNRAALEKELNETFEAKVSGHKLEKIFRKRITPTTFESKAALEAKIEEYSGLFSEVPDFGKSVSEGSESGAGKVDTGNEEDAGTLSESDKQYAALLGLSVN